MYDSYKQTALRLPRVWSYLFTTSPVHAALAQRVEPHRPWGVDGYGESPMAGRGIGAKSGQIGLF